MSKTSEKINRLKKRTTQLENKVQQLGRENSQLLSKIQQLENLIETQDRVYRGYLANLVRKSGIKDFPKI